MQSSLQFVGVLASAALMVLTGCTTSDRPTLQPDRKHAKADGQTESAVEILSSEASERRAEGHAHYAAGMVHDWNEEWDQAAGEYYAAALADPSNEVLVLDA